MRDQFWSLFTQVKFQLYYASLYRRRFQLIDKMLTFFCLVSSTASITAWGIWQQLPWLWSAIVGISQVIQLVKPELPWLQHTQALRYAIPEYRDLANEIEDEWLKHCDEGENAFQDIWRIYVRRYTAIQTRYFSDDSLPEFKGLAEKAMQQTELYCKLQHYIQEEVKE